MQSVPDVHELNPVISLGKNLNICAIETLQKDYEL